MIFKCCICMVLFFRLFCGCAYSDENSESKEIWKQVYKGLRLYEEHNIDGALKVFEEVVKQYPSSPEAWAMLGNTYTYLLDYKKAKEYLDKAYAIDSNNHTVLVNIASYYVKLGKYNAAIKYYFKAQEVDPKNPVLYLRIADCYIELAEEERNNLYYNRAIESLLSGQKFAPESYFFDEKISYCYLQLGDKKQAGYYTDRKSKKYLKYSSDASDRVHPIINIQNFIENEKYGEAEKICDEWINKDNENSHIDVSFYYFKGYILYLEGNKKEAEEYRKKAIVFDPMEYSGEESEYFEYDKAFKEGTKQREALSKMWKKLK